MSDPGLGTSPPLSQSTMRFPTRKRFKWDANPQVERQAIALHRKDGYVSEIKDQHSEVFEKFLESVKQESERQGIYNNAQTLINVRWSVTRYIVSYVILGQNALNRDLKNQLQGFRSVTDLNTIVSKAFLLLAKDTADDALFIDIWYRSTDEKGDLMKRN